MIKTFWQTLKLDLRLAQRSFVDLMNAWFFFILIVILFPFAVNADSQLLHRIAPGIIWVAALLASLIVAERLFHDDVADGSLDLLLLSPQPLAVLVAAKIIAHWLVSNLALILITPFLSLLFNLTRHEVVTLMLSLLLGTPILSLLSALIAALTLRLRNSGVMIAILLLPLTIPILILGVSSVIMVSMGLSGMGFLLLLLAILVISISLLPGLTAYALRF